MKTTLILVFFTIAISSCHQSTDLHREIDLNGEWEIAKTDSYTELPSAFESKVPVPGLVDLAVPALDADNSYKGGVYWYRTKFNTPGQSDITKLKLNKAKYHAVVYLNDNFVGEHVYCFTPKSFDIKEWLNAPGESNELLIGVGTVQDMPDTVMWGQDFEKLTYIPGIYDDVKLIQSGYPFIRNIQTAPLIEEEAVRIVADIEVEDNNASVDFEYQIKELESGKEVANGKAGTRDFKVRIPNCQLWTPESPFLYELTLSTRGDKKTIRFGMRSFAFDPESGRAVLNGEPYYMRGTNVCIFRFFEDPDRAELPWDEEWAIKLHEQFKSMNWNSIRYCIGFPPERWYEIADSLGFLIQNEYPVWTGGNPEGFENFYPGVTAEQLANEYRSWLPEHWNHPSVVIWDAQNESVTEITGEAINLVRNMDLSNRPWENGWAPPQSKSDPMEAHPYLFSNYIRENQGPPSKQGALHDLLKHAPMPTNDANSHSSKDTTYSNPIIINEYAWLWLNRDGSTTTLTDRVYDVAFGENLTKEERVYLYCRHLGMLTEYWRAHRYCAGVLHFCGLAYSRSDEPRGQTSDHFIDIKNLIYEPQFVKYVKPAFSPVGIMVDFWDKNLPSGEELEVEVYSINDLDEVWNGEIKLRLVREDKNIKLVSQSITIPAYGKITPDFKVTIPEEKGEYKLIAEIEYRGEKVMSIREFTVQ